MGLILVQGFSSSDGLRKFLRQQQKINYLVEIPFFGWIFSENLPDLMEVIASFNWSTYLELSAKKNHFPSITEKAQEVANIINSLKNSSLHHDREGFSGLLVKELFYNHDFLTLFDLENAEHIFHDYLKNMFESEQEMEIEEIRNIEMQKELDELLREEAFIKKLEHVAKDISKDLSLENLFDSTILDRIVNDNKKYFVQFDKYKKILKYISLCGKKSGIEAVKYVGKQLSISEYDSLKRSDIYQEIHKAYKFFSLIQLKNGWEYILKILAEFLNKSKIESDRIFLHNYLVKQKKEFNIFVSSLTKINLSILNGKEGNTIFATTL